MDFYITSTKVSIMADVEVFCPVCEADSVIAEKEIRNAMRQKGKTGEMVLITCPECCHVMYGDPNALVQWEGVKDQVDPMALGCLELTGIVAKVPAGSVTESGVPMYNPGGGGNALTKRAYMLKHGINPECYLAKQKRPTPTKVGK